MIGFTVAFEPLLQAALVNEPQRAGAVARCYEIFFACFLAVADPAHERVLRGLVGQTVLVLVVLLVL